MFGKYINMSIYKISINCNSLYILRNCSQNKEYDKNYGRPVMKIVTEGHKRCECLSGQTMCLDGET